MPHSVSLWYEDNLFDSMASEYNGSRRMQSRDSFSLGYACAQHRPSQENHVSLVRVDMCCLRSLRALILGLLNKARVHGCIPLPPSPVQSLACMSRGTRDPWWPASPGPPPPPGSGESVQGGLPGPWLLNTSCRLQSTVQLSFPVHQGSAFLKASFNSSSWELC